MNKNIEIVCNGICIDHNELKKIIVDEWQSGIFYDLFYDGFQNESLYRYILGEISDHADAVHYNLERKAQQQFNRSEARLDWFDEYPKSDVRSIGFEVLHRLSYAWARNIEELTTDDIPAILEFLDTPPDKSLEAWDKWEKYWDNLDYPARRKKLLEHAEEASSD